MLSTTQIEKRAHLDGMLSTIWLGVFPADRLPSRITQNPFPGGKHGRTISLNTHYVVLFKNPRDSRGVRSLMEQAFPANLGYAMDSYAQAINDKPFSYLLLDLHQQTPDDYRLRTNVLPFELPHYCFLPTK